MRRLLVLLHAAILAHAAAPTTPPAHESSWSVPLWLDPPDTPLSATEISAFINNQPVKITKILTPQSDLVILLALDLTGDLALVEPAKQALATELEKLSPNTWVGVLQARGDLSVLADPTPDRAAIAQLIQSLPIAGKAGLLDTVEPVAELASDVMQNADVRVAVLYITDSDVTNYREDLTNPVINSSDPHDLSRRFPDALVRERAARLERQLAHTTAPVFIVHLQYRSSGLNQSYQSVLGTLAESTSGFTSLCRSAGNIPDEIAGMFAYIRSSYFLKLSIPPKPAAVLQLRLEWNNESKSETRLAYRARRSMKQR